MRVDWRGAWENHPARWSAIVVVLAAFAASAASLANGYALDDTLLLQTDPLLHSLADPWKLLNSAYWRLPPTDTLWRPLGMVTFAAQWVVGSGAPLVFHAVNVALYAGVAALVLALARQLLPAGAALLAGLVFAVHPLHVESVGNIVGQLELWVALALLSALWLYLRDRRFGRLGAGAFIGILLLQLAGLGFKEHAVLLPLFLCLLELTVLREVPTGDRESAVRRRMLFVGLVAIILLWMLIRSSVLGGAIAGDWPHVSLKGLGAIQRGWVMLALVPEIARLMLWPAQLYADYSPQLIPVLPRPDSYHLVGAVVVASWAAALLLALQLRDRVATLAILWVPLGFALVANIIVPTGILLAERTLFFASIGVALLAGAVAARFSARLWQAQPIARTLIVTGVGALLTLALAQSSSRQQVWRDNTSLIASMLADAPQSFRGHLWLGDSLMRAGDRVRGERELQIANEIWPEHEAPYLLLGIAYQNAGLCEPAIHYYRRSVEIEPMKPAARFGLGGCLVRQGRFSEARRTAIEAQANVDRAHRAFAILLLTADSALAATDSVQPNNRWILGRGPAIRAHR